MSLVYPLHNPSVYQQRRERVAQWMLAQGGGVAVVPTGDIRMRNADSSYPFRFDSHFYYLRALPSPMPGS